MTLFARKTRCPACGHDPVGEIEFLNKLAEAQKAPEPQAQGVPVARVDPPNEARPYRHLVRLTDLSETPPGSLLYAAPTEPQAHGLGITDDMVSRFLCWRLPSTFSPDCGISFDGRKDDQWNKNKTWPVGTNLLSAIEARAMLEHVLAAPQPPEPQAQR